MKALITTVGAVAIIAVVMRAPVSDHNAQVDAEKHAAQMARHYVLKDRGKAERELKHLAIEAQYAELRERMRKKK